MWYNLTPAEYAKGLRFNADRCDQQAAHHRTDGKSWSEYEAQRSERNALRLRAMAMLCDISTEPTTGKVDFFDMSNPAQSREDEAAAIARAEALFAQHSA